MKKNLYYIVYFNGVPSKQIYNKRIDALRFKKSIFQLYKKITILELEIPTT